MIRSYNELILLPTFEERFEYLKLDGRVGEATFGFDRYLNQALYKSKEWRFFRNEMFIRDGGCDLAIPDREIFSEILLHHINPITPQNIENRDDCVFDPNNVITTIYRTHRAIHYGDASLLLRLPPKRKKGDTAPWKVF